MDSGRSPTSQSASPTTPAISPRPPTPWYPPRVLYLQHASDPIVWWSPDLLLARPDWLVEPRGDDVSPAMGWYPVVTFWQVTADLTHSQSVPDGHGHNYNNLILDGWAAVGAPRLDRGGHRPGSSGAQRLTARSTRAPVTDGREARATAAGRDARGIRPAARRRRVVTVGRPGSGDCGPRM